MPDDKKPNAVEAADWEIQGNRRLSDGAIDALAELALDLVEAAERGDPDDGDPDGE